MTNNLIIYGEKTKLRPTTIEDVAIMCTWPPHKDILYYDYNFPNMSADEIKCWLKIKTSFNKKIFTILNKEERPVGYISLRNLKIFRKRAEMGIVINPSLLNKGYGQDAIKAFTIWYFNQFKYKKLILTAAYYNDRAIHVYKKLGFKITGEIYTEFLNTKINPLTDENYQHIRKYFKNVKNIIYVRCFLMELSTLSTDIQ